MTSIDDLDGAGRAAVESYLHACKTRTRTCTSRLDAEFQGYRDASILQDTYTREEADNLLCGYFDILKASLSKQHNDFCMAHAEMIEQVLQQGEKHGGVQGMVSKLDAPDLEKQVAMLEEELARKEPAKMPSAASSGPSAAAAEADLRTLLQTAKEETKAMQQKAKDIQEQFNAMMRDKTAVQQLLNQELDVLRSIKDVGSTPSEAALSQLRDEQSRIESDAATARKEASSDLKDSSQFASMKALIQKRNEETKELRERIQKFQSEANDDDGDD